MMKRILPILILTVACVADVFGKTYTVATVPNVQRIDRTRYTSNPDGILSAEAVESIDRACDSLRRAGKAQIAVVAIDDIAPGDVFTFAHRLFSEWGVGSKDANNGLGILLVKDKREIRFVTGDGLEGILPDALCKRIQQRYMVEPFSSGDFSRGMVDGVAAVAKILSGNDIFDDAMPSDEETGLLIAVLSMVGLFVLAIGGAAYYEWTKSKCPNCGKHKLGKTDTLLLASNRKYDMMEYIFKCRNCGYIEHRREKIYKDSGGGGIFMGGGGLGGGSSMGGGFGGGHFGGGGSGSKF